MFEDALCEFHADWVGAGKSLATANLYRSLLIKLHQEIDTISYRTVADWIQAASGRPMQRKRAQAVRAFGKWSESVGDVEFEWWRRISVPVDTRRPQVTARSEDYERGERLLSNTRDRAILAVLWGCGLRRGEAACLDWGDVNLVDRVLVVRRSKTGSPRVVPMPLATARSLRRLKQTRSEGCVFGLSSSGIHQMLKRHGLLPAHAWRRGWAVEALRQGVSETSLRSAAGWSSGEMVAVYTKAAAAELAQVEFARAWSRVSPSGGWRSSPGTAR